MRLSPEPLHASQSESVHRARVEEPLAFIRHRKGIIVGVMLITLAVAAIYLLTVNSRYTSTASFFVQPVVAHANPADKSGDKYTSPGISSNFLNTQREIVGSVPVLALATQKPEISSLKTFAQTNDPVAWLRQELRIEVGKTDDLIRVELDSPYPKEAAEIVQAVVDSYIEFQTGQKHSAVSKLLDTYQKKKGEAEAHVADLDRTMRQIQKQAGTLSFDQTARDEISRQMARNREELADAARKVERAKSLQEKAVQVWGPTTMPSDESLAHDATTAGAATVVFSSEADLARRPAEIIAAEQKLEKLLEKYLPQHPAVKDAQERVRNLKLMYLAATRRYMRDAEREQQQQIASQLEQTKLADSFADHAAQFARLESDKKELDQETSVLGNRIKDIQLEEETGVLNITVVDAAMPGLKPTKPNRPMVMLLALVGGLVGGLAMALVRHQTDPRFRTPEELETSIQLPVLGCVPAGSRTAGNLNPANPIPLDKWSDNAETCRQIAASLKVVCPKGAAKAVLITSPRTGQGRSTVARDLAIALAGAGEKVLLVDADFQNPSLHALVGTRNTEGLSSVINGEVSAELATISTSVAGLEVLTTGPVPPLPAAIFDSPEFESFLTSMAHEYDRVLLDAPPVNGSNDARIAALACGATLLVLPQNQLHKRVIAETRDRLIGFGATLVGIVMNDLPRNRTKAPSRKIPKRKSVTTLQSLTRMVAGDHDKTTRNRKTPSTGHSAPRSPTRD